MPESSSRGVVAIVATERTGTNFLIDLVNKNSNIKAAFEIFHKDNPYGLSKDDVSRALNLSENDLDGASRLELAQLVRASSKNVLSYLELESDLSLFKIFPGHLPIDRVSNEILLNEGIHKVAIDRRPLDVFISSEKAQQIGSWKGSDTTNFKVLLDSQKYIRWLAGRKKWYEKLFNSENFSRSPGEYLHYDEFDGLPVQDILDRIAVIFSHAGIDFRSTQELDKELLQKQDRSKCYSSKVINWEEFSRSVSKESKVALECNSFFEAIYSS